jgi:hypothetical protein
LAGLYLGAGLEGVQSIGDAMAFSKSENLNANFTNEQILRIQPQKIRGIRPFASFALWFWLICHMAQVWSSDFEKAMLEMRRVAGQIDLSSGGEEGKTPMRKLFN